MRAWLPFSGVTLSVAFTKSMSVHFFAEIQNMKRNWDSLFKEDFEELENKKAFITEIALKLSKR
jgi:hypothetical protein